MAIVREMAKDPSLSSFDPDTADVLVVPASGVRPSTGPAEAITEGLVPGLLEEASDHHAGS